MERRLIIQAAAAAAGLAATTGLRAQTSAAALRPGRPFAGQTVNVLSVVAPQFSAHEAMLPEFERLTGIQVKYQYIPFASMREKLTAELVAKTDQYDVLSAMDAWGPSLYPLFEPLNARIADKGIDMAARYPNAHLRAARGVYTSLVTDTGWFKYSNTDAETFAAASEAVQLGVEPARLYNSIYQRQSRQHPLGISRALSRLEYYADGRLAVVDLPQAREGEVDLSDGDDVLDLLRAVARVEVVLFLREQKDGAVKLSARSKTDFNVHSLARRFGGGGHAKASGATFTGTSIADVRARLVAAALEAFSERGAPAR